MKNVKIAMESLNNPEGKELIKEAMSEMMTNRTDYSVKIKDGLIVVAAKSKKMNGGTIFGGEKSYFGDSMPEIIKSIKEYADTTLEMLDSAFEAMMSELEEKLILDALNCDDDYDYEHDNEEEEEEDDDYYEDDEDDEDSNYDWGEGKEKEEEKKGILIELPYGMSVKEFINGIKNETLHSLNIARY